MDDLIKELGTKNLFFCQSATIHSEEIGAITEKCISEKKFPIFHVVSRSIVRQHPQRVPRHFLAHVTCDSPKKEEMLYFANRVPCST